MAASSRRCALPPNQLQALAQELPKCPIFSVVIDRAYHLVKVDEPDQSSVFDFPDRPIGVRACRPPPLEPSALEPPGDDWHRALMQASSISRYSVTDHPLQSLRSGGAAVIDRLQINVAIYRMGGPPGARTRHLGIKSPLLYPMS